MECVKQGLALTTKIRPSSTRTDENAKCIFYAECFTLRAHYDKKSVKNCINIILLVVFFINTCAVVFAFFHILQQISIYTFVYVGQFAVIIES